MTEDLERQLARYGATLRGAAGPVDLEEVRGRGRPSTSLYRPGRAVAAGASLVLASIGVLFLGFTIADLLGTDWPILRKVAGPVGRISGPGVVAVVTGGGAIALMGLTALFGLRRKHLISQQHRAVAAREKRKKIMQTLETPVAPIEKLEKTNRYLIMALVVMTLLAIGLGAWLIVDNTRSSVERSIGNLLDEYGAAWEANDGDAALALMTSTGAVKAGDGNTYSGDNLASVVDSLGAFSTQPLGDLLIVEKSNHWLVAQATAIDYGGRTYDEMDLLRVVESDGDYLIDYHETWRVDP